MSNALFIVGEQEPSHGQGIDACRLYRPAGFPGGRAKAGEVRRLLRRLVALPFSALIINGETATARTLNRTRETLRYRIQKYYLRTRRATASTG
jgi:hypothetical protein